MQQLMLHEKLYHINKVDETEYSKKVYERLDKIKMFDRLKKEGCSTKIILEVLKMPQSTFYRWKENYKKFGLIGLEDESKQPKNVRKPQWKLDVMLKILEIRRKNPVYGKAKITVILKRDYMINQSESTVGRILAYYIKRDQVKSAYFYYAKKRVRSRTFNNHAKRWKQGMKAKVPGELFQIDHMTISLFPGYQIKHFQGICPITKMVVEQVYSNATSNTARKFLEFARDSLPFSIKSVQVDGGSEFMKDFEQECKNLYIPLWVLPPRSPEYNANVERANGAAKYEFYIFYSGNSNLSSLRNELSRYVKKYNTYRPHQALQYLTPAQYYYKNFSGPKFSHMY